jgi:hypothetical protein
MAAMSPLRVGKVSPVGIFWGGLIAGTLDILAAFVTTGFRGRGPDVVLHFIASGLLGPNAFRGGFVTAALGLACHYAIAFGSAAAYYAASRLMPILIKRAVICGLLFGIPVYIVTNYVIVPLSKIGHVATGPPSSMAIGLAVLMVFVGLPISLAIRHYSE